MKIFNVIDFVPLSFVAPGCTTTLIGYRRQSIAPMRLCGAEPVLDAISYDAFDVGALFIGNAAQWSAGVFGATVPASRLLSTTMKRYDKRELDVVPGGITVAMTITNARGREPIRFAIRLVGELLR